MSRLKAKLQRGLTFLGGLKYCFINNSFTALKKTEYKGVTDISRPHMWSITSTACKQRYRRLK